MKNENIFSKEKDVGDCHGNRDLVFENWGEWGNKKDTASEVACRGYNLLKVTQSLFSGGITSQWPL